MNEITLLFNCCSLGNLKPYGTTGPCHLHVGVIAAHGGLYGSAYAPLAEMPVELHTATFEEWCQHEWAKPLVEQAILELKGKMVRTAAAVAS